MAGRWDRYPLDGAPSNGQSSFKTWSGAPALPGSVDLRGDFGPVADCGADVRAATSFAFVSVAEFILRRTPRRGAFRRLSPLYHYHWARSIAKTLDKPDSGLTFPQAGAALQAYGLCPEAMWPWDPKQYRTEPTRACRDASVEFITISVLDPWDTAEGVMRSVAEGNPVVFRYIGPADLLRDAAATGRMALPPPTTPVNFDGPGHPMVVVGYDLPARTLIIRNCWGADWGTGGHVIMPLDLYNMTSPNAIAMGPMPRETEEWQRQHGRRDAEAISAQADASPSRPAAPDASAMRKDIRRELETDVDSALKAIKDRFKPPGQR